MASFNYANYKSHMVSVENMSHLVVNCQNVNQLISLFINFTNQRINEDNDTDFIYETLSPIMEVINL